MNPLDCEVDNDDLRCPTCGWVATARHVRRNCPPKLEAYLSRNLPPWWAWGTWLAIWLKAWGISPKLVAWTLAVDECGCKRRELLLNVAGMRFAQAVWWLRARIAPPAQPLP